MARYVSRHKKVEMLLHARIIHRLFKPGEQMYILAILDIFAEPKRLVVQIQHLRYARHALVQLRSVHLRAKDARRVRYRTWLLVLMGTASLQ